MTRRVNGTTGIFLLLSDEAADAIGLAKGDVERIVAAPIAVGPAQSPPALRTLTDPDDPRTGLAALLEELNAEKPVEPVEPVPPPAAVVTPAPEPAPVVAQGPEAAPVEPAVEPAPEPAVEPALPAAPVPQPAPDELEPSLARNPQKQLFLQPREEEIAVTTVPQQPIVVAAAPANLQEPALPPEPQPVAETGPEPSDAPPRLADAPLAEPPLASPEPPARAAAAPAAVELGPVVTDALPPRPAAAPGPALQLAEAPQPDVLPGQPAVAVAPGPAAAVRPPEPAVQPVVAAVRVAPTGDRPYYVQLGAFAEESSARELERRYGASYPIDVQAGALNGRSFFRVVVGPLGRDETGSVLQRFHALGFRDAFVRSMN